MRKTCWITGASSGIGRELALRLVEQGHTVYGSARSVAGLQELQQQSRNRAGKFVPLPCDVANDAAMAMLFHGDDKPAVLDSVILAAGICEYIDLPDLDTASIRRVMDVNFHGVVNSAKAALPLLQAAAREGSQRPELVGIGSMSSYIGFPRAEAYGAAKAAMACFLTALRCDVQQDIDVTVIYPGFVATPMTAQNDFPMPFVLSVEDAAAHILARLGKRRRSIAFPWQLQCLLKLAVAMPGLWYGHVVRRLARQTGAGRV